MNKRFLLLIFTLVTGLSGYSQIFDFGGDKKENKPKVFVTPTVSLEKSRVKVGEVINLLVDVKIEKGWKLYTVDYKCDPTPFNLEFDNKSPAKIAGDIKAPDHYEMVDDVFGCKVNYFKDKGSFIIPVKFTKVGEHSISFKLSGLTCSTKEGQCFPFNIKRSVSVQVIGIGKEGSKPLGSCCEETIALLEEQREVINTLDHKIDSALGATPPPNAHSSVPGEPVNHDCTIQRKPGFKDIYIIPSEQFGNSVTEAKAAVKAKKKHDFTWMEIMLTFIEAFIWGLAALIMPCVFPLIPMTVSYFTKHAESKGGAVGMAVFYGLSIIGIFISLGLVFAKIFGGQSLTNFATSWVNVVFAVVFVIFAASFFGLFEITLPSGLVNKMDRQADKKGLMGVFFMAFTLCLTSFSCTGPIVASVLMSASNGYWIQPIIGMLGFSLALAIPFTFFAIFPSRLNSLPKSGGWLNSVKVILGFIELALCLKFLSMADLVYHWGILNRDVFLILWVGIFGMATYYLLGKIRLPHDSTVDKIGVPRLFMIIIFACFTVYLATGFTGNPLKMLSGILPPQSTMYKSTFTAQLMGYRNEKSLCQQPMYSDKLHLPQNLKGYFDLRQAICCAKEQNKPILVDFTGHGCANCRRMEDNVWSDPIIWNKLNDEFILLSLYTDDRIIRLPKSEVYIDDSGDKIEYLGSQNLDLEINTFNSDPAQPYYFILGYNEPLSSEETVVVNSLVDPKGYQEVDEFSGFLERGIKNFRKMKK